MTDEYHDRVLEVLNAVAHAFTIPRIGGGRMAARITYFHLMHLQDMFIAVGVLLARRQPHPAFVIARSMFETSLMLGAMEDPATRDGIALSWVHDSNARMKRWVRLSDSPEEVTDGLARIDEQERELLARARDEFGIEELPAPFKVTKAAALSQGRLEDYRNYVTGNHFTHGNYSALKLRVEHHDGEERTTFHLTPPSSPDVYEAAANFACRSALLGLASACRIFDLPAPESLPALLELIEFPDPGVEGVE